MSLVLLVGLAAWLIFCFGVLCGWSWAGEAHRARTKKQMALQRQLNEQMVAIRKYQAARRQGADVVGEDLFAGESDDVVSDDSDED